MECWFPVNVESNIQEDYVYVLNVRRGGTKEEQI